MAPANSRAEDQATLKSAPPKKNALKFIIALGGAAVLAVVALSRPINSGLRASTLRAGLARRAAGRHTSFGAQGAGRPLLGSGRDDYWKPGDIYPYARPGDVYPVRIALPYTPDGAMCLQPDSEDPEDPELGDELVIQECNDQLTHQWKFEIYKTDLGGPSWSGVLRYGETGLCLNYTPGKFGNAVINACVDDESHYFNQQVVGWRDGSIYNVELSSGSDYSSGFRCLQGLFYDKIDWSQDSCSREYTFVLQLLS